METIKQAKDFDCVKMMRDIRDEIDAETAGMTFKELRTYINRQLKRDALSPRITHRQKASSYAD
jgi:hypothetical protein